MKSGDSLDDESLVSGGGGSVAAGGTVNPEKKGGMVKLHNTEHNASIVSLWHIRTIIHNNTAIRWIVTNNSH